MKRISVYSTILAIAGLLALTAPASAMYQPALGKWLTRDPAGYTDGLNTSAYLGRDPSGEKKAAEMTPDELRRVRADLQQRKNYSESHHHHRHNPDSDAQYFDVRINWVDRRLGQMAKLQDLRNRRAYNLSQHGGRDGLYTKSFNDAIAHVQSQLAAGNQNIGQENLYLPPTWDDDPYVKGHNCYSYAMNDLELNRTTKWDFAWPGRQAGRPEEFVIDLTAGTSRYTINCPDILARVLADGGGAVTQVQCKDKCPAGKYKVAVVVADNEDFHFYRQNPSDCTWSHKRGQDEVTKVDAGGLVIVDPEKANRNYPRSGENPAVNYTSFCGCVCVPEQGIKVK